MKWLTMMKLRSALPEKRAAAVMKLGAAGSRSALQPLLKAAEDESREVRIAALEALARLRHPAAAEPLASLLASHEKRSGRGGGKPSTSDSAEFELLSNALGAIGSQAVAPLLRLLASEDRDTRRWAARSLGLTRDPRGVAPLIQRLADARSEVRKAAASALGEIGDASACAPLIAVLSGRDHETRRAAALALGAIGAESSVDALHAASNDPNEPLQLAIVESLGKIGGLRAAAVLRTIVDAGRKGVRDAATAVLKSMRIAAANPAERAAASVLAGDFAAAVSEGETAVQALTEALASRDAVRRKQAAESLGDLRTPSAVEPLLRAMRDHDPAVQSAASKALAAIGDSAVSGLAGLVLHFDPTVQCLAARSLGGIGSPEAAEPLVAAIEQSQSLAAENPEILDVAQTACEVLSNLVKERGPSFGAPVLERIAALPETIRGTASSHTASRVVDCTALRDLARHVLQKP